MDYPIRPLSPEDKPIVWEMLRYAAHESSWEALQHPLIARYATDWGRPGDLGYGAWHAATPIGAAWLRLWPEADKGFGYVSDDIPELAIGVAPDYRGQGVGTRLLTPLLAAAKEQFSAVSLSVRGDNPAVHLYSRVGFVPVSDSKSLNRTGSDLSI
ncbi:MAG: GNAT family N-acetyltransferase [Cyanobacteria bacterium P01_C01_bin.147]